MTNGTAGMKEMAYSHRILARAAGASVSPGDRVNAGLDRAVLSGARVPATLVRIRDQGRPWSPDDVLLTMDFQAPEVESEVPRSRALCRELVSRFGLSHVFDLNMGIGSQVVLETCLVTPGQFVVGSGRCLGVLGAVGVLGIPLSETELAAAMIEGRYGIEVPPAIRVELRGKLKRYAGPWDMAAAVADLIGPGIKGQVVEFSGSTQDWPIDLRIGICGLLTEIGARAVLFPPDDTVERFFDERGIKIDQKGDTPGEESYASSAILDAGTVVAVEGGDYTGNYRRLARDPGEDIQGVFIGSCYGGRYDDLALVAEVLKKATQVHPGVRLVISPATLETARASLAAGFYETFLQAGAMVVVPGGGPGSAGGGAIFGDGERIASTAEYHRHLHPGQGVPDVHILSPASAAVAATSGALMDPAVVLA